jgi:hypothetical protein
MRVEETSPTTLTFYRSGTSSHDAIVFEECRFELEDDTLWLACDDHSAPDDAREGVRFVRVAREPVAEQGGAALIGTWHGTSGELRIAPSGALSIDGSSTSYRVPADGRLEIRVGDRWDECAFEVSGDSLTLTCRYHDHEARLVFRRAATQSQ